MRRALIIIITAPLVAIMGVWGAVVVAELGLAGLQDLINKDLPGGQQ